MRRSRSLEEWERKKSYLIRSLFEDIPILSPILERHESAFLSSPTNYIYRPESPLPELIIELEPKKPNLHDEPEELYEALAKEMRRLYRKDFLDIDLSTDSPENSKAKSLNAGIYDFTSDGADSDNSLVRNSLKDRYQMDYNETYQIDNDVDSTKRTEIRTSKESSESLPIASKQVTSQADVHLQEHEIQKESGSEQLRSTKSKQYRQSEEDSLNVSKTTIVIESIEVGEEGPDKGEITESESLSKVTDASSHKSSSESSVNSSHTSPEVMRQRQPFESLGTPPHRTLSKSNSSVSPTMHFSMEVDSKEYYEDVLASNKEIEIAESSNETLLLATSTPTLKRTSTRFSTKKGYKRRLVSYSSSSSFASVANKALQTSFPDCETDWSFFWSNFFVGIPTAYNICSCKNHVCST